MPNASHLNRFLPATLVAAAVPPLVAYNVTPSATLFNEFAALLGWGWVLLTLASQVRVFRNGRGVGGVPEAVWAMVLIVGAMLASPLWTRLPLGLSLSSAACLGGAALLMLAASRLDAEARAAAFEALAWGLLLAGLLSVLVCVVQVFKPEWADGDFIARSGVPGRSVGNLRQPNHLASLLLWGCVAATYLAQRQRLARAAFPVLLFAMVFCLVTSASRTGYIGGGLLVLWGLLDFKLARSVRISLISTVLMFAVSWELIGAWAHAGGHAFGAESRLVEGAGSPARLAILHDAWGLVKLHPWLGVGWGEFNLAWTMTPFPDRPVAFFDHCHDLPMQLLAELGTPLALLVLGLLLWSLVRLFIAAVNSEGERATQLRSALMLVLMIGLHSIVEYPLWYAYFLFPAAFALGLGLEPASEQVERPAKGLRNLGYIGGLVLILGTVAAAWDYQSIIAIYAPKADAPSLEERIADGQRSWFFAPLADYAAATSLSPGPEALAAAQRTAHNLIDTRLMMAWAKSLHAVGDDDRARYIVQRLKEFHYPESQAWIAECDDVAPGAPQPFQCAPPQREYTFEEMR